MVLIFSKRSDFATSQVCSWLYAQHKPFLRLNEEDNYSFSFISFKKVLIIKDGNTYDLLKCDSYWYRRDGIAPKHFNFRKVKLQNAERLHLRMEYQMLKEYVYSIVESSLDASKKIGSFFTRSVNKLSVLNLARQVGLNVPVTYVVSDKKRILSISNSITKPIYEGFYDKEKRVFLCSYTMDLEELSSIPSTFMASCIQEKVDKAYELRVFFLRDKFFSFATFSQQDSCTTIDCRKGEHIRYVPYKIPCVIRKKLHILMDKLKLVTGSIDLIVNKEGQYVFLEVNPVGQFVAYGEFGNLYLDKLIADNL